MRLASKITAYITVAVIGTVCLPAVVTTAQETDAPTPVSTDEHTFEEIILTEEGVIATDTTGDEWKFDFDQNRFVKYLLIDENIPLVIPEGELAELGVEERCTEEFLPEVSGTGTITVQTNQYVKGDIITNKRVTVKGWVQGNIESLDGRVLVRSSGQVDGDIVAPRIIVHEGAIVLGKTVERQGSLDLNRYTDSFSVGGMIIVLALTFFFLLISFLTISLAPEKAARFYNCFRKYKVRCFFAGFFTVMLMPIILVLIVITVVGLLVLPLLPLAYLLAGVLGLASLGNLISYRIIGSSEENNKLSLLPALGGIIIFMLLWLLVSVTIGSENSTTHGFGIFVLVMSILISIFPYCAGVGAAVLTRFGFRDYKTWHERQSQAQESLSVPKPPPMRPTHETEPFQEVRNNFDPQAPELPPNRPFPPPSPPHKD